MFASIFVAVASLIVLQVLLVLKVADFLSPGASNARNEKLNLIDRSAGRFTGIA